MDKLRQKCNLLQWRIKFRMNFADCRRRSKTNTNGDDTAYKNTSRKAKSETISRSSETFTFYLMFVAQYVFIMQADYSMPASRWIILACFALFDFFVSSRFGFRIDEHVPRSRGMARLVGDHFGGHLRTRPRMIRIATITTLPLARNRWISLLTSSPWPRYRSLRQELGALMRKMKWEIARKDRSHRYRCQACLCSHQTQCLLPAKLMLSPLKADPAIAAQANPTTHITITKLGRHWMTTANFLRLVVHHKGTLLVTGFRASRQPAMVTVQRVAKIMSFQNAFLLFHRRSSTASLRDLFRLELSTSVTAFLINAREAVCCLAKRKVGLGRAQVKRDIFRLNLQSSTETKRLHWNLKATGLLMRNRLHWRVAAWTVAH